MRRPSPARDARSLTVLVPCTTLVLLLPALAALASTLLPALAALASTLLPALAALASTLLSALALVPAFALLIRVIGILLLFTRVHSTALVPALLISRSAALILLTHVEPPGHLWPRDF